MDSRSCHRGFWESVHYFFPGLTAIHSAVNCCFFSSVIKTPRSSSKRPHSCIHYSGIAPVHCNIGASRIFIDIQDFIPCFTAIHGFKHASFGISTPFLTQCTNAGYIRVIWVHNNSFDALRLF